MTSTLRLLLLTAALAAAPAYADRTYKWVDADGTVHYSNRLPPESSRLERKEIDKQGRVLRVYRAPLTEEEKLEQQRLAELAARKKERAEKRAIHDRSLLATYNNVEDMEKAREEKITMIEAIIRLTNSRVKSMQERLLNLSEEAAQYERSGKQLPFTLHSQITNLRDQIDHNSRYTRDKQIEIEEIRQQFDSDIARFRELTDDEPQQTRRGPSPLEIASRNPEITLDRHDRTLLTTFSSVEDLVFARNEEIGNIDTAIRQVYDRIDVMQSHLAELSNNADEYEAKGEVLPEKLLQEMKKVMREISDTESTLQDQRELKLKILDQFERDIQRFKVLTASK